MNLVMNGKRFYVSYNPYPAIGYEGEETALVLKGAKRKYYILIGDYRKQYKKLIPKGYAACKRFFDSEAKKGKRGGWSN